MGWGWDLWGTAALGWTPYFTGVVPALQGLILAGGLAWASATARQVAGERLAPPQAARQALPIIGFCLGLTLVAQWLLIG